MTTSSYQRMGTLVAFLAFLCLFWVTLYTTFMESPFYSSWHGEWLEDSGIEELLGTSADATWNTVVIFLGVGSLLSYAALWLNPNPLKRLSYGKYVYNAGFFNRIVHIPFLGYLKISEATVLFLWAIAQCLPMAEYYLRRKSSTLSRGREFTTEGALFYACRMFGVGIVFNLVFAIIPICKHSFWLELFDVGFERAVMWHRILGWLILLFTFLHTILGVATYIYADSLWHCLGWSSKVPEGGSFCRTNLVWINIYGEIAFFSGAIILVTALEKFRRWWYRAFYVCHWLWIPFLVFGSVHDRSMLIFSLPGLISYIVDKTISSTRMAKTCTLVKAETIGDVTKIVIQTREGSSFIRGHGQWMYLNIPKVSAMEWHPMSIAAFDSEKNLLTFDIRHCGKWSSKLGKVVHEIEDLTSLKVRLNGPFGGSSHFLTHESALFISGGIGITAHLLAAAEANQKLKKTTLVWVVPSPQLLQSQLNRLEKLQDHGVEVHVYFTSSGKAFSELDKIHTQPNREPLKSWDIGIFEHPFSKLLLVLFTTIGTLWSISLLSTIRSNTPSEERMPFDLERGMWVAVTFAMTLAGALTATVLIFGFVSTKRWLEQSRKLKVGKDGDRKSFDSDNVADEASFSSVDASSTEGAIMDIDDSCQSGAVKVNAGRPNVETLVKDAVRCSKAAGAQSMSILVCGPSALVHAAHKSSQSKVIREFGLKIALEEEPYGF